MQNRTSAPYLAAISRILIPLVYGAPVRLRGMVAPHPQKIEITRHHNCCIARAGARPPRHVLSDQSTPHPRPTPQARRHACQHSLRLLHNPETRGATCSAISLSAWSPLASGGRSASDPCARRRPSAWPCPWPCPACFGSGCGTDTRQSPRLRLRTRAAHRALPGQRGCAVCGCLSYCACRIGLSVSYCSKAALPQNPS
jgi:hypothetical protein